VTNGGNLTINGTLALGSSTYSIGANILTLNSGLTSKTGNLGGGNTSTLTIGGSGTFNTLDFASGTNSLYNFNVKRSGGITIPLGNSLTVKDSLNFTSGIVSTGPDTLSIATGGIVTGGGTGRYVYGNLLKNVPAGTSVSRTFEVGDASEYLPAQLNFNGTITTAGNVMVSSSAGLEAHISSSCIDTTRDVKPYWTISNLGVAPLNYNATLNFNAGDVHSGASTSSFGMELYNGSAWTNITPGTRTSTSTKGTGITGTGDLAIGNVDSTPVTVTVTASLGDTICSGASVTFTAHVVNGGTVPAYQWIRNRVAISGATGSTYKDSTISNNDSISVQVVSNAACAFIDTVKSGNKVIKVNPLPSANAGSSTSICSGDSTTIGASAVTGDTYSWVSNPSGFASTLSNPSVYPTITTTYTLTEKTLGGCQNSNSVTITVNPLPSANAGSSQAITSGGSASIGAASVTGDTYSWTSNPSGFTSTVSNPTVSPTVTTVYTLTETVTATGCTNSNGVAVAIVSPIYTNTGDTSQKIGTIVKTDAHATGTRFVPVNGGTYPGYTCSNWSLGNISTTSTFSNSVSAMQYSITPKHGYGLLINEIEARSVAYRASTSAAQDEIQYAYSTDSIHWTNNGTALFGADAVGVNTCSYTPTAVSWTLGTQASSPGKVWIRKYVYNAASSGNELVDADDTLYGATYAIDNIYDSLPSYNSYYGNLRAGKTSASAVIYVSGYNLSSNVVVTPPTGFEIRTGTNAYSSSPITLTPTSGSLANTAIDVIFAPTTVGVYSDSIRITSIGAVQKLAIGVSGNCNGGLLDNPSNFTAVGYSPSQINVTWSLNANHDSIILARSKSAITYNPVKGKKYNLGDTINNSNIVIIHVGNDTAVNDTGLASGTKYYYAIWSDSSSVYSTGDTTSGSTKNPAASVVYINGSSSGAYVYANSNLTATNFSYVNGATTGYTCTYFAPNDFPGTSYSASSTGAIQFSITPKSGYEMTLSGFHAQLSSYLPGSGGPTNARLAYSLNNGTTWVDDGTSYTLGTQSSCLPTGSTNPDFDFNFSSPIVTTGKVMFRIYAYGQTAAGISAVDEFVIGPDSILGIVTQLPVVTVDTTSMLAKDFGAVKINHGSSNHTFHVSGTGLTSGITITPPAGFEVGTSPASLSRSAITINEISGAVARTTVYVQFDPTTPGPDSALISVSSSGGVATQYVNVIGDGYDNIADPIHFTATGQTYTTISLGWNLNAQGDSVLLAYSRTNSFSRPVSGKVYHTGDTLGAGDSVIYINNGTSFTHTGLLSNTKYYYKLYSDSAHLYSTGVVANDSTLRNYSVATDYFQSNVSSGNYNTAGSWQSSSDSSHWVTATLVPDYHAHNINIVSGDSLYVSAATPAAANETVNGTLAILSGGSLSTNSSITTKGIYVNGRLSVYGGSSFTVAAGSIATINSAGNLTIGGSKSAFINNSTFTNNGTITIYAGDTFRTNSNTVTSTGALNVYGDYNDNASGGSIPAGTWYTGSNLDIYSTAVSTHTLGALPGNMNQNFYNVNFNAYLSTYVTFQGTSNNTYGIGQVVSTSGGVTTTSIQGSLNINCPHDAIGLFNGSAACKLLIGGNFTLASGSEVELNNFGTITKTIYDTIVVGGNMSLANGVFRFYYNYAAGASGAGGLAIKVLGNVSAASNVLNGGFYNNADAGTGNANFVSALIFGGSGTTQTLSMNTGTGTYSNIDSAQLIKVIVSPGANVDLTTVRLAGTGTFSLGVGSTLKTSYALRGLAGAIGVSGTKTFDTTANYIFGNSGSPYFSGFSTFGIKKANNVTLAGGGIVTNGGNLTINGTLALGSSTYSIGANILTLNSGLTSKTGNLGGGNSSYLYINGTGNLGPLPFSSSTHSLKEFHINRGAGDTVKLGSSLYVMDTLNLISGILSVGNDTLGLNGHAIQGTVANLYTTMGSSLYFGGSSTGISLPSQVTILNGLVINNVNGITLNGNFTDTGRLNIMAGTLPIGNHTLTLNGGLTLTGTLTGGASSNIIIGGNDAAITLPAITLYDLKINRPNGANTNGDITINDSLVMYNGNLNSWRSQTSFDTVTIDSTAWLKETQTSQVIGVINTQRYLQGGSVKQYFSNIGCDITVANTGGMTTITRGTGPYAILTSPSTGYSGIERYYHVQPSQNEGNLGGHIYFHFSDNELNGISKSSLMLFRNGGYPAGHWTYIKGTSADPENIDAVNDIVDRGDIDSFSMWTLGSSSMPLPVELISYTAILENPKTARLDWATASELNNDHFIIERSIDNGATFAEIGTEKGAGTSYDEHSYTYYDNNVNLLMTNVIYYRLKQMDINGTITNLGVRAVYMTQTATPGETKTWYNQGEDRIYLEIVRSAQMPCSILVTDIHGKMVGSQTMVTANGATQLTLNMTGFAKGIYNVTVTDQTGTVTKQLMKY